MGEGLEGESADLAPVASGVEGGPQAALDHAEDRFRLPALAVGFLVEASLHQTSPMGRRRFLGGAFAVRWNDGPDAEVFAEVLVNPLCIVTGVGHQGADSAPGAGVLHRLH